MKTVITKCENETLNIAGEFAKTVKKGDIIALFGTMGMGKTVFVRGFAQGLGLSARVSSPTYAIVHEYASDLVHFDMYRIQGEDDLYSTGFYDYLDMGRTIVIEWSEKIEDVLPQGTKKILIEPGESENSRRITFSD